jgi:Holliday junction resolvasome RuvABC ATP-dependent DNA helicase subunit
MKDLWVEKYRPKTLKEYVVRDEAQRQQIQSWIDDKAIPHLLLSGAPGVGKTTLAKVLFAELDVSSYDIHQHATTELQGWQTDATSIG